MKGCELLSKRLCPVGWSMPVQSSVRWRAKEPDPGEK